MAVDSVKRYPVDNFPGWWRIENPRRYITPFGNTISNAKFHKLRDEHGNDIPESEYRPEDFDNAQSQIEAFNAAMTTPVEDVQQDTFVDDIPADILEEFGRRLSETSTNDKTEDISPESAPIPITSYNPGFKSTARPRPQATVEDSITKSHETAGSSNKVGSTPKVPILPDPVLNTTRASSTKASSKELAAAFKIQLIIVTSVAALLTDTPELEMTDGEAMAIAIPAANLLEKSELNKKVGRLIAGSGDYTLLGYALVLYGQRVGKAIMLHVASKKNGNGQAPQQMPAQPQQVQPQYRNGYAAVSPTSVRGGVTNPNVAEPTSNVVQASNGALVARANMPTRGVTRTFNGFEGA